MEHNLPFGYILYAKRGQSFAENFDHLPRRPQLAPSRLPRNCPDSPNLRSPLGYAHYDQLIITIIILIRSFFSIQAVLPDKKPPSQPGTPPPKLAKKPDISKRPSSHQRTPPRPSPKPTKRHNGLYTYQS